MIFIFFIPYARITSFKVYPWNCIQMDTIEWKSHILFIRSINIFMQEKRLKQ